MKKAKLTNQEKNVKNEIIEEEYTLKKFIIIVAALLLVFALSYFITTLFVKNNKQIKNNTANSIQIDSDTIIMNHLLDRSENEYYVLAFMPSLYNNYTSSVNYINLYNKYISDYSKKENSLKIYKVNLDDALNKNYIGEDSNISTDLKELKVSDEILFKIKDSNIENYYKGSEQIIKALSSLN